MTELQQILLWALCAVVGFLLLLAIVWKLKDFPKELRYLNQEIARSTGAEQRRWRRRKRKLLLSLLPFVKY